MSETKKRKVHLPEFKAKVGLEALRGVKTINEIGQEYGVRPAQVSQWRKEIQEQAKPCLAPSAAHSEPDRLYGEIGRLKMELDWLKKSQGSAYHDASNLDKKSDAVGVNRQCVLAGVSRATMYAWRKPKVFVEDDHILKRLIDEQYTCHLFYGSRKMVMYLGRCGHSVNRKRAQRLMRIE
jgi:transposase-like protein